MTRSPKVMTRSVSLIQLSNLQQILYCLSSLKYLSNIGVAKGLSNVFCRLSALLMPERDGKAS